MHKLPPSKLPHACRTPTRHNCAQARSSGNSLQTTGQLQNTHFRNGAARTRRLQSRKWPTRLCGCHLHCLKTHQRQSLALRLLHESAQVKPQTDLVGTLTVTPSWAFYECAQHVCAQHKKEHFIALPVPPIKTKHGSKANSMKIKELIQNLHDHFFIEFFNELRYIEPLFGFELAWVGGRSCL